MITATVIMLNNQIPLRMDEESSDDEELLLKKKRKKKKKPAKKKKKKSPAKSMSTKELKTRQTAALYAAAGISEQQSRAMSRTSTITSKGQRRAALSRKHYYGYLEGKLKWNQLCLLKNTHQRDEVKVLTDILVQIRLESPYTKVHQLVWYVEV